MMPPSVKSFLARNYQRVRLLEAHDQESKEIIRHTLSHDGQCFDGIWLSGLTQTTCLGIPDTELISPLRRALLMSNTSNNRKQHGHRPLCAAFDADSGGPSEEIPYLVDFLSSIGVSMIVIEDKSVSVPGQKVNSLAGASHSQGQADIEDFAAVLRTFKTAPKSSETLITARIESFTTRVPEVDPSKEAESVRLALDDALTRSEAYKSAGADAIMIHSKSKSPNEVLSFLTQFRLHDPHTPLVVVPTTYGSINEDELYSAGANVIIYANHLMRAKITSAAGASDLFLARRPDFTFGDEDLDRALRARNLGCLSQKLAGVRTLSDEAQEYRKLIERCATMGMKTVTRKLLEGKRAGAVEHEVISARELLEINAKQVTALANLIEVSPVNGESYRALI